MKRDVLLRCFRLVLIPVLFGSAFAAFTQRDDQAELLLQSAVQKEMVEGDLEQAIELYRKLVASHGGNRPVAAQALVRMGQCYEKLGKREAEKIYEEVVNNYADQAEPAARARERLSALRLSEAGNDSGIVTKQIWPDAMDGIFGSPSPDGKYLSYLDWLTGNLAVRDIEKGNVRKVTQDGTWEEPQQMAYTSVWSPDGRSLAYHWTIVRRGNQENQLRTVGLDNSTPRILLQDSECDWIETMDWSPKGDQILVSLNKRSGETQLAVVSVQGSGLEILKRFDSPIQTACFSPNAEYIAYSLPAKENSFSSDLFLHSLQSGAETLLVGHPADDALLGWVPGTDWILFASDRTGSRGLWGIRAVEGKAAGEATLLKSDIGRIAPLGFSRSGSFFYSDIKAATDIFTMEIDPDGGTVVAEPKKAILSEEGANMMPAYSPDGRFLAYISKRYGMIFPTNAGNTLCIRSLRTGEEKVFFREFRKLGLQYIGGPRWLPDGRSIMISGFGKERGLYRLDTDSGSVERIFQSVNGSSIAFGPGGQYVYFVRKTGNQSSAIRRRLEDGKEDELVSISGNDSLSISLSPDGQWLAFSNRGRDKTLQVMPSGGGEARILHRLEPRGYSVSHVWSPDGRFILFTSAGGNNRSLCRLSVETGEVQELSPQLLGLASVSIHPDGRHIAFRVASQIDSATDVWVMHNYLPESGGGN